MTTTAILLTFAFTLGMLAHLLKLPSLIGYLSAGFLLSAFEYQSNEILEGVAHAGVLVLLFSVGLKISVKSLLRWDIFLGSILHLVAISGILILLLLTTATLSFDVSLLIAVALAFSSTVVAAKILEAKLELRAFHGRVAIGILIMQDLAAVAILSVGGGGSTSPWALLLLLFLLLRPALYRLLDISGHEDLLLLFGLLAAIVLGGGSFEYFGMSSELGALLLGVLLSEHKRAVELSAALWGLKEVLLVGFFLQIGLAGHPTLETFTYAAMLTLVLPVKALLFFFILLLFRLRARSAFLAALSLATYSEFGLIIANMGVRNGWLTADWLVLLAITVALSFTLAAPANFYAHNLYRKWAPFLRRFESSDRHPDDRPIMLGNSHFVVMGMGRVGTGAYDLLSRHQQRVIGMDSDPGKVEKHREQGRRVLYGDAEDPGLWENLHLEGVHAVLLAMPDLEARRCAVEQLRAAEFHGLVSAIAVYHEEVAMLLQLGADKVYSYYEGVGVGFAEYAMEEVAKMQSAPMPNPVT